MGEEQQMQPYALWKVIVNTPFWVRGGQLDLA